MIVNLPLVSTGEPVPQKTGRTLIRFFCFHLLQPRTAPNTGNTKISNFPRLIPAIYTWRQNENHSIAIVLLIAAGVKLAFLPVIVQPHIATTLMMELDVHHLSKWTEHLNVLSLPPYIILVGLIKEKWRIFLRYHLGLEIVPPLTFIFVMFLLLFGVHPRPEALMVVSAAPLSMAYLWLQVLPLASFNQMIVDWQHSTPSNDIFRILWQKEKELMFLVRNFPSCRSPLHGISVPQTSLFFSQPTCKLTR